jgi:hypothetical protein
MHLSLYVGGLIFEICYCKKSKHKITNHQPNPTIPEFNLAALATTIIFGDRSCSTIVCEKKTKPVIAYARGQYKATLA